MKFGIPFAIISILTMVLTGCGEKVQKESNETTSKMIASDDLYLVPSGESDKRASEVLPMEGSEDATSVLKPIPIDLKVESDGTDCLPSESTQWIVRATPSKPLKAAKVAHLFGKEWRKKYGGMTIYGRDTTDTSWTFLISSDGPSEVDDLQFAWPYFASWSDEAQAMTPERFEVRLKAIERAFSGDIRVSVRAKVSPANAAQRAVELSRLTKELDRDVTVSLVSPKGKMFQGKEIWDVMLSLGLKWGDMDIFHWVDPSDGGVDSFFSVWTSTEPGYFLPEEIAAGRVNCKDLIFGFSIPRSVDPVAVFDRLLAAVRYSQRRLGGNIMIPEGKPLDEKSIKSEISSIVKKLKISGFDPGSIDALRQF